MFKFNDNYWILFSNTNTPMELNSRRRNETQRTARGCG